MAIETFTWRTQIQAGMEGAFSLKTRSATFGDGYEQIAGEGINPEKQSWPVTLTGKKADMLQALKFFRSHVKSHLSGHRQLAKQGSIGLRPNQSSHSPYPATF
nr:MAG TPA: minor tail protein [Caudoviricetes sp.]